MFSLKYKLNTFIKKIPNEEYDDNYGISYIERQVHFPAIPYRATYSWSRGGHSVDIHSHARGGNEAHSALSAAS